MPYSLSQMSACLAQYVDYCICNPGVAGSIFGRGAISQ